MAEKYKNNKSKHIAGLSLAAIGIVYGDIGTSVLYAFRESFHKDYGLATSSANILGVLSLIFWALTIVISIKYLTFVLRADNKGEGGIIALTALIIPQKNGSKFRWLLVILGLFGASLLYGDSMITPAISVLSAVEGLEVATPVLEPYIIPITIGILLGLFILQQRGTAGIGKIFGPITTTWFIIIGALGVYQIIGSPEVFKALNPIYAIEFFMRNGISGFLVLGSVFLVVTGGEALYADVGHFGIFPIRLTWFCIVLPALVLNYFGQGALLLQQPTAVENPFFLMGPDWALYPLVIMAAMATIIASQAVISGAFSLTRQAMHLGYLPRLKVIQTSKKVVGQIYMPAINWILMIACIGLVLGFKSSSNLAAAYGVGVTSSMVFTSILFCVVLYRRWKWKLIKIIPLISVFLIVDLSFWGANIIKVPKGGWFPLLIAAAILLIMTTWKKGRRILSDHIKSNDLSLEEFLEDISFHTEVNKSKIKQVPGTAIYLYSNPKATPPALLQNIKHNKTLHENVVVLSSKSNQNKATIAPKNRISLVKVDNGFYRIVIHSGFAQQVDIPVLLTQIDYSDTELSMNEVTYFVGKERILPAEKEVSQMSLWRDYLFALLSRNQQSAIAYFNLPSDRIVEIGTQVKL